MMTFLRGFIVVGVMLTWIACAKQGGDAKKESVSPGKVLAKGSGFKVTQGDVDDMLTMVPPQAREFYASPQMKKQIVDRLVANEVMYKEAVKRGIDRKPEVNAQIENAKRSVYAKYLMDQVVLERTTDEVLKTKYDQEKDKYAKVEVKASHILVKDQGTAKKVYKRAKGGEDFAKLAQEFSEDPTNKDKGGDLGWFTAEKMVKPFSDAAFAMKPGELSEPVKTQFGYHIIRLDDRRDSAPFDEVKERIRADLSRTIRTDYVEELKRDAKVEYVDDSLKASAPQMPMGHPPMGGGAGAAPKSGGGHEGHGHP